jgi:hypothetical protein
MSDPLMTLLADLPLADPDRSRTDQTTARCRARLARARASDALDSKALRRPIALWTPVIATVAIAYVAEAIVLAFRTYTAP